MATNPPRPLLTVATICALSNTPEGLTQLSREVALIAGWEFDDRARTRHGRKNTWTIPMCRHPKHTGGRWRPMARYVDYAHDSNAILDVVRRLDTPSQENVTRHLLSLLHPDLEFDNAWPVLTWNSLSHVMLARPSSLCTALLLHHYEKAAQEQENP